MKTEPIINLRRRHPQTLPSTPPSSRDVIPGLRDPFRSRGGITGVTFRVPKQHPVLIAIASFLTIGTAVAGITLALSRPPSSPAALYAEPPTVAHPAVPPPPAIVVPPVKEPVSAPVTSAETTATPSAQPSASAHAKPRWVGPAAPATPATGDSPYDNAAAPAPASTTIAKPDSTLSAPGTPAPSPPATSPSLGF